MSKNIARTEKGGLQYAHTENCCLDLFSTIGSSRVLVQRSPQSAIDKFQFAYRENPETAISIVYWARAVREGAGERKVFYTYLEHLYKTEKAFVLANIEAIAKLGYWKDFANIYDMTWVDQDLKNTLVQVFANVLNSKKDALAFKWAPRKGALAKHLRDYLELSNKGYRQFIHDGCKTVEHLMSERKWDDINYEEVPSKAFKKYRQAFGRHDMTRLVSVLTNPDSKLCANAIYPHEVLTANCHNCSDKNNIERLTIEAQWKNLPNYIKTGENILPLVDVSGSMSCPVGNTTAMHIAISIGLYCSERCKGKFNNRVITFHEDPKLYSLDGTSIVEKYNEIARSPWGGTTNFESAYNEILKSAKMWRIPQSDMPTMLLVLSDMQFDQAGGYGRPYYYNQTRHSQPKTNFEDIKAKYKAAGYEMPMLVYWNLNDADTGTPATKDQNVALVSGFSTKIMESVLGCVEVEINTNEKGEIVKKKTVDPIKVMNKALEPIKKILNFEHLNKDFSKNVAHIPSNFRTK